MLRADKGCGSLNAIPQDTIPNTEQPSYMAFLDPSQAAYPDYDWSALLDIPVHTWNTLHAAVEDQYLQFGDITVPGGTL